MSEAEIHDPDNVGLSKAELLQAIRTDCVTFFSFYLQDELTLEVPELHEEIWGELLGYVEQLNKPMTVQFLKKLFAIPREHAKSTIAKLAVILFLKYTPLSFVLYTSKTVGHADNAIRDILLWLGSAQEAELFGPIHTIKSSETNSLWIVNIQIRTSMVGSARTKTCIFKALGAGSQVRGLLIMNKRPEIIVADDIEDVDNTTPELQPKLDRWFFGSFLKSFAKKYFILLIGNMITDTSILARVSKEPSWNPTVFGSIVRNKITGELEPLWKGRHTVESLLEEYRMFRRMGQGSTWEAEMMNLTQEAIFRQDMKGLVYMPTPDPEELESGALVLDPAFGENRWNDDAAITVHARVKNAKIPCIIDSWASKVNEQKLFDKMIEMSFKWGISTWIIESEAAQKLLIPLFNLLFQEAKINKDMFILLPISSDQKSKASRILAFRKIVREGSYALADTQEELSFKLGEYNPQVKKHDDLCDSASYGTVIWAYFNETITANGIKQLAMVAFGDASGRPEIQLSYDFANF